ncbi:hypothetical protein RvY_00080 [Ramazzottius varieornatus]|uniref:Uncharacterized protein n=1 Tax=Ramazzottius varieornatus TaxID=947166 RepID=A0A1D1ULH3_RAMVA|nr:hypothetical protein RvY_00080 [Ramazzottius varieornatus]
MSFDGLSDGTVNYNLPNVLSALCSSSPLGAQPDFGCSPLHRLFWILSQLYLSGNSLLNDSTTLGGADDLATWLEWNPLDLKWLSTSISQNASDMSLKFPAAETLQLKFGWNERVSVDTNSPLSTEHQPVVSEQQKVQIQIPAVGKALPTITIDGQSSPTIFASISPSPLDGTVTSPNENSTKGILRTFADVVEFFGYLLRGFGLGWLFNIAVLLVTSMVAVLALPHRATLSLASTVLYHTWNILTFAFQSFDIEFVLDGLQALTNSFLVLIRHLTSFVVQVADISGLTLLLDMALSLLGWVSYFGADILHSVFSAGTVAVYKIAVVNGESFQSLLDFITYFFRGIGLGWLIDGTSYVLKTFSTILSRASRNFFPLASDSDTVTPNFDFVNAVKQQRGMKIVTSPTGATLNDDSELYVTNPSSLITIKYFAVLVISSIMLYWASTYKDSWQMITAQWNTIKDGMNKLIVKWKSERDRNAGNLADECEDSDSESLLDETGTMYDTDEELQVLRQDVLVSQPPDQTADINHYQPAQLEGRDTNEEMRLSVSNEVEHPSDRMQGFPFSQPGPAVKQNEWRRFSRPSRTDSRSVPAAVPTDKPQTRSMILPVPDQQGGRTTDGQMPLVYDSVSDLVHETSTFQQRLHEITDEELRSGSTEENPHRSAAEEILRGSFSSVLHDQVSKWVTKLRFPSIADEDDSSTVWETSSYEIESSPRYSIPR